MKISVDNFMDLKLDGALKLANKKLKEGSLEEAKLIYQDILRRFPANKKAKNALKALSGSPTVKRQKVVDPPVDQQQLIITLYNQGQLQPALDQAKSLLEQFPHAVLLHNICGAAYAAFNQYDAAIDSFKQSLRIKPDDAVAHYNMGVAMETKGELDAAIDSFKQALKIKPDYAEAKINLTEILKTYSPKNKDRGKLIDVDNKIKEKHDKNALPTTDSELAIYTMDLLSKVQSADKNLRTESLQIYRRNTVDLNCKRHMAIFTKKEIIPKFCFGCYKVQVEVKTVLDLIRLAALFYEIEFESDLLRKCLIEVRPNISGSYKGLIYCRGIDQANSVKKQLDALIKDINKNLIAKIKKGCSEFPLTFPQYGEVGAGEEDRMQYPREWQALETEFDKEYHITPKICVRTSLKEFCLSDYLIIQKWIDYSKGIGDPTSELFCELPVQYEEIWKIAKARM